MKTKNLILIGVGALAAYLILRKKPKQNQEVSSGQEAVDVKPIPTPLPLPQQIDTNNKKLLTVENLIKHSTIDDIMASKKVYKYEAVKLLSDDQLLQYLMRMKCQKLPSGLASTGAFFTYKKDKQMFEDEAKRRSLDTSSVGAFVCNIQLEDYKTQTVII